MIGSTETFFLVTAVLLVLSVIASKFSDRFGIPALLIFLGIGMLAGSEGIGGIYFDDPGIAQTIGLFALTIILFSGGLDTRWENISTVVKESLTLATLGVLLTALVLGLAAHFILGVTLFEGLLIGAITSSTDAAAVFSLLRSKGVNLNKKCASILEFESGSNDPMAVFLTIAIIFMIQVPDQPWFNFPILLIKQVVLGSLFGLLFGQILLYLINRLRLGYDGLYPVLTIGVLLLTYALTSQLQGSAFLAIYMVGLTLARADFLHKRSLIRFFDSMAWLFQIIMFLVLGLLVFPSKLVPVILPGILLSIILIFIARPLSVWISLIPFSLSRREKSFISWVGLRGAVPIILATYPRLAKIDESGVIFNVVFFVVITSVIIQGTTIPWFAKIMKVEDKSSRDPYFPIEIAPLTGWKGILSEIVIPENSYFVGKAIFEIKLPRDYLVVLIYRKEEYIIPNGSIELKANDRILGLARSETQKVVNEMMKQSSTTKD